MRILNTIHLTANQKRVIALIAVGDPTTAASQISSGVNMVAARNALVKLGVITFTKDTATLTQLGTQIATDENIIDQAGQLTDNGQQAVFGQPASSTQNEEFQLLRELLRG